MRETTPYQLSNLILDVSAVIVLTLSGPFGTFVALSVVDRALVFGLSSMAAALCVHFFVRLFVRDPLLANLPRIARIGLGGLFASLPSTGLVRLIGEALGHQNLMAHSLTLLWFQITLIAVAVVILHYVVLHRLQQWHEASDDGHIANPTQPEPVPVPVPRDSELEPSPIPVLPPLISRLAPEHHGEVISLTAQDHYVEVTTTGGSELVLMRLSDAIDALPGVEGLQVHRSHWVARNAIVSTTREGGRTHVTLRDGRVLPVASAREKELRAAMADTSTS